jgi:hypothetical protein
MKHKLWLVTPIVLLVALCGVALVSAEGLQPGGVRAPSVTSGTAFTYQGQLKKNGAPLTDNCSLQFTLLDAGGITIAGPVNGTPNPVSVTQGLFTVQIDFGTNVLNGEARNLQIDAKCTSDGSYVSLTPWQTLTPAPMAFALPGFYTQQNINSPNIIGGYSGNKVTAGMYGATLGGGEESGSPNQATVILPPSAGAAVTLRVSMPRLVAAAPTTRAGLEPL